LEGWLYLAVILDLFSRRVVGWKLGESLEAELVVAALRNALVLRQPDQGLYFHSDRGSQYSSEAVRKPLSVIGAKQSMSGVGNCYDNAAVEAFFSTLKTECFPDNQVFRSRAQARCEIFEYIEVYYSNQRLHSALGYQTPCQYETQFKRVIDSEIDLAQGLDAATEDRALRGRTSSADAALQTAGVAALARPTAPGPDLPEQAQSVKSQGGRGTESPDSFDTRNRALRVRFFGASTNAQQGKRRCTRPRHLSASPCRRLGRGAPKVPAQEFRSQKQLERWAIHRPGRERRKCPESDLAGLRQIVSQDRFRFVQSRSGKKEVRSARRR
jgi:Integrase core domain